MDISTLQLEPINEDNWALEHDEVFYQMTRSGATPAQQFGEGVRYVFTKESNKYIYPDGSMIELFWGANALHGFFKRFRNADGELVLKLSYPEMQEQINEWTQAEFTKKEEDMNDNYDFAEADLQSMERTGDYVDNTTGTNNPNEKKEERKLELFHFMTELTYDGVVVTPRFLTTTLKPGEAERYPRSLETRRPVNSLLAISTGNWLPWLLIKRAADRGVDFRLMVLNNKDDIAELDPARVAVFHDRANYSWATASHTFFLQFHGVEEWGLAPLGLIEADVKKLAKRFAEISRLSEMAYYNEISDVDVAIRKPRGPQEFFDGMNYISEEFAIKMAKIIPDPKRRRTVIRQIKNAENIRWNLRADLPGYLIKGDAIVVEGLDHDIVAHPENVKKEFRTDGWGLVTAMTHAPFHVASWDTQSWINNPALLPGNKHREDVELLVTDLQESFQAGVVPDWILLGEEAHLDDGLPDYERLSELMNNQTSLWQLYNLPIPASQNFVYMVTNGEIKRMERYLVTERTRYYKKTWVPMTNAFLGGIVTYESLTKMGKITLPKSDYLRFHSWYGLVMSGQRFLDTYHLHGGWDLDDSVKVILAYLWSDDQDRIDTLVNYGALDPKIKVASSEADAKAGTPVAGLVRSPNGPGEYSFEALDPNTWMDMPWHMLDVDKIPVINLADLPDPQGLLLKNVNVQGVPESLVYTNQPLTRKQSLDMVNAQRFNPGIGQICNCLMNWANTFGPSFPAEMLAKLEDMVDAAEQTHDQVSFEAIAGEVENLYEQMVELVLTGDFKVDALLAIAHPVPEKYGKQMRRHMTDGRFSKFNRFYDSRVNKIKSMILGNSFQMREATDVVRQVKSIPVSNATMRWAKQFEEKYAGRLRLNDNVWATPENTKSPFVKMHYEVQKTLANKATIAQAAAELRAFGGIETHKRVLSLWHYILIQPLRKDPDTGYVKGKVDRLMFAPGEGDSVMHVLIEALIWRGLATELPVQDEG